MKPLRPRLLRILSSRPRLLLSTTTGLLVSLLIPDGVMHSETTRVLIGWNAGAFLYIALALRMMTSSSEAKIKKRAETQDEGQFVILLLSIIASMACLSATLAELAVVKDIHGSTRFLHIALTALTIASSWLFTHIMFALHYAHDFHRAELQGASGGLLFPGNEVPEYLDFLYVALVIGTSGQTADVSFSSRSMRRTGTLHCVLAFFFNTTVLALTINIGSSLV